MGQEPDEPAARARQLLRLVLVEDRRSDAELTLHELRSAGFDPEAVIVDTEAAFIDALRTSPDVILTDFNLPQFDGLRAIDLARLYAPEVPVLMVTGVLGDEAATECIRRGAVDYLLKDRLARIGSAVTQALKSSRLARSLLDHAQEAIVVCDASGIITRANLAAEALGGPGLVGHRFSHVFRLIGTSPHALPVLLPAGAESFHGVEARLTTDVSTPREVIVSVGVLPGTEPVPGGYVITLSDVTELRHLERLHESEQRFRTLFEASPIPLVIARHAGNVIVDVNDAFVASTGFRHDDVIGQTVYDVGLWADAPQQAIAARLLEEPGRTTGWETAFRTKSGDARWARISTESLITSEEPLRIIAIDDVTDRVKAEEALKESRRWFEAIFRSSPVPNAIADAETGNIIDVNDAWEAFTGRQREEVVGLGEDHLFPGTASGDRYEVQRALAANGHITNRPISIKRPSGEVRQALLSADTIFDRAGSQLVVQFVDVTEQRCAEKAVLELQQRLQAIQDHSPTMMSLKDRGGRYVMVNRYFEAVVSRGETEMVGKTDQELFPEELAAQLSARDATVLASNSGCRWEARLALPDGERVFLAHEFPLEGPDGAVQGLVAISTDITDLNRAEQDLAKAKATADAANRAKSEFLSRMSHELRTPLNVVLGFGQVLEMADLGREQREHVGHILTAGRHLLELIDEVLDISRIESGRTRFQLEPVEVLDLVRQTVRLLEPMAQARGITVSVAPGGDKDELWAVANAQRLKQVLLNLLSNAIKYNRDEGAVTVTCGLDDAGGMKITVTDTGPGIPPEKLGLLFQPFERLGAEATDVPGTGLGLALSKVLVEAMKGKIGAESTVGTGSAFWVVLAHARQSAARQNRTEVETPIGSIDISTPRKILYIEDNHENLDLVAALLRRWPQVTFLAAVRGRLGLDLAREERPDLILLDLHLPDIPGEEVLRQLRQLPETQAIPVIVASADAQPRTIERLRAAGAAEYLTKPLDVREFFVAIAEALREAADPRS